MSCVLGLGSWVYESCALMMTKANRNKVNHSGQVRRKAKPGLSFLRQALRDGFRLRGAAIAARQGSTTISFGVGQQSHSTPRKSTAPDPKKT
jgi:hypothetical protein